MYVKGVVVIFCIIAATILFITDSFAASKKSEKNKKNAEAYCAQQEAKGLPCKVSKTAGCGPRWKDAKRFRNGGNAWYACKPRCPDWKIKMEFIIGAKECSNWESKACRNIVKWLRNEIRFTESIYSTPPGIKIVPSFAYTGRKGGRNLDRLNFKTKREYQRYMDNNFDHVKECKKRYKQGKNKGKCKQYYLTRGAFRMLVTNYLAIADQMLDKNMSFNGFAYFPLFSRRHAPILVVPNHLNNVLTTCPNKYTAVMAHELGHVFNLQHTFERDVCNGGYEKREGSSLKADNTMNLMDYGRYFPKHDGKIVWNCAKKPYLNTCQKRKAAFERTINSHECRVAYGFLKGLR